MTGMLASELRLHVIRPTLKKISLWSESAENLLLGTVAQESQMGRYLTQIDGPALGIYQIEPTTHEDVWKNYLKYRPELADKVGKLASESDNWANKEWELIVNLAYATAIARLIYYRVADPLPSPNDLEGLAAYYKQHYNTALGKATEADFLSHYQEYVLV